jgi:CheY-like chemotaxis protein
LVHATDAAQEANRAKSRFLATMSHEIRTPMNGILGMAQLLLMPQLKESERQDYARTILTSGQSLMSLLNDILDLSKIESGRFQLESTVFDPVQLMRETQGLFSGSARAKNLQLEHVWTGPAGSRYLGDSHRLRQMLSNLVGNAIKFTAKGQIKVESSLVLSDSSAAVLEFSVSDTGMGIPEDKLGLLFQPFSQTDSSTTRQFGGSGLGLSIVLSLAKMMGGEVGVESQTGIGSRFWFRIRVDPAEAGADRRSSERQELESAQPASSLPHAHVLVAEDNPVNRKVVGLLLSRLGMRISMAHDGQQAVNAVQRGEHIDVVLMDINMPVMDGYAATQRIRQWESENARLRIPIVALTADAFEEDQRRCLVAGMDDFLTKPIAIGALKLALGKWLPKVPPLSQNDFTDEAHGNAPIDLSAALPLIETLSQLLAKNMFDAIPLVKELQRLAAQTAQAQEVDEVAALVKDFNFSLALERLRILATQPWTKAAT